LEFDGGFSISNCHPISSIKTSAVCTSDSISQSVLLHSSKSQPVADLTTTVTYITLPDHACQWYHCDDELHCQHGVSLKYSLFYADFVIRL